MATFIIEHCDKELYEWSLIEYEHISSFVGKKNLLFTNVNDERLEKLGAVKKESVLDLDLKNAVILDPFAEKELSPDETFDHYIFGGILGSDPPTRKTEEFLSGKKKYPTRNLGPEQMATDNAVYFTKLVSEGKKISEIPVVQELTIETGEGEEVILPYKYVLVNGKALIAPKLAEKLKRPEEF